MERGKQSNLIDKDKNPFLVIVLEANREMHQKPHLASGVKNQANLDLNWYVRTYVCPPTQSILPHSNLGKRII